MLPPVEMRQLESFVALAEELHFARAAKRVHITRSALSEQMRRLESVLQVHLVKRTTRSVRMTPTGELFLGHARLVLAQADLMLEMLRRVGAQVLIETDGA